MPVLSRVLIQGEEVRHERRAGGQAGWEASRQDVCSSSCGFSLLIDFADVDATSLHTVTRAWRVAVVRLV